MRDEWQLRGAAAEDLNAANCVARAESQAATIPVDVLGHSQLRGNSLGEGPVHILLLFSSYVGVHGDTERDIALHCDEADELVVAEVARVSPDAVGDGLSG